VAVLNPDDLFDQAEWLLTRPNEVDVRRAVSAAYYGLFHAVLTAAADQAVGEDFRTLRIYGFVYRSISHASLRDLCGAIKRVPDKYKPHVPHGGFDNHLREFATALIQLYEKRQIADYDPVAPVLRSDAVALIGLARQGLMHFEAASDEHRMTFLTLLLIPPRGKQEPAG
jgi:hypothetical protein